MAGWREDSVKDMGGFALSAQWLEKLDRPFRWTLHAGREALRAANLWTTAPRARTRCGLILGGYSWSLTPESMRLLRPAYLAALEQGLKQRADLAGLRLDIPNHRNGRAVPENALMSGMIAGLAAQALSLEGPHYAIDAACSSALYCLKLASLYLWDGQCDVMLAGGISAFDSVFGLLGFAAMQALPDGSRSRPLDAQSDGLAIAEGAGMFVLKRLSDARRDGDPVHAIIRGIGLSNDGRGRHLLAPSARGQERAYDRAYGEAGLAAGDVDYVECHSTGTALGDKTELESLAAFCVTRPLLGSVKANMGHLLAAAGFASALKVVEGIRAGIIPATIGIEQPLCTANGFGGERIVLEATPWPPSNRPKRGAVNAFGFGGANAHLILEEASDSEEATYRPTGLEGEPLAIVGMDGIFGSDEGLEALRLRANSGASNARDIPNGRWWGIAANGMRGAPQGGYLDFFDIDPLRYHLPPEVVDHLNRPQILMLRVADHAIKDSGLEPGRRVAVLIATAADPASHRLNARWEFSWVLEEAIAKTGRRVDAGPKESLRTILQDSIHPRVGSTQFPGYIGNLLASRVAALWDFNGPAFTVSAEENSVFRALEIAQLLLASGEAEAVVLGSVDLAGSAENVLLRRLQTGLDPVKPGAALDAGTSSWSIGEGAGAIVLQRRSVARAERRRIRSSVQAIAMATGRPSRFQSEIAAPSIEQALERAVRAALAKAGRTSEEIGCVEGNASGIPEEDAAEARVLARIFDGSSDSTVALGSAKAVWGHCYAASGIAALIRATLGLEGRCFFPSADWSTPRAELTDSRFFVPRQSRSWFAPAGVPRITAVTGLSQDGSAACAILSEEPHDEFNSLRTPALGAVHIVAIPAAEAKELPLKLGALAKQLEGTDSIEELSRQTLQALAGRPDIPLVLNLAARSREELSREIRAATAFLQCSRGERDWRTPAGSSFIAAPLGLSAPIAFVYPAIDTPYPGMMHDLFQVFPRSMDRLPGLFQDPKRTCVDAALHPRSLFSPTAAEQEQTDERLRRSPVSMLSAAIVYSSVLTTGLREALELEPAHALGFSVGECAMLFALGVWTTNDDWLKRLQDFEAFETHFAGAHRSARDFLRVREDEALEWSSHVLLAPADRVREAMRDRHDVFLAQISTPAEVVITGREASCHAVIDTLQCESFRTDFGTSLHCAPAALLAERVKATLKSPVNRTRTQCHFSAGRGPESWTPESVAQAIADGLVSSLDFPGLVHRAYDAGARLFIEIGPRNTCTRRIKAALGSTPHEAIAFDQKQGASARDNLARMLGALLSHRVPVNLDAWLSTLAVPQAVKTRWQRVSVCGSSISQTAAEKLKMLPNFGAAIENGSTPPSHKLGGFVHAIPPVKRSSPAHLTGHGPLALLQQKSRNRIHSHQMLLDRQMAILRQRVAALGSVDCPEKSRCDTAALRGRALFNEAAVMEFAEGKISRVFGPEYALIDTLPRRVRLPSPPFLALSRVMALEAIPFSLEPCWIETEYDVPNPAWYGVDGNVPYMAADAQGVLFLLGYLGIDRHNQGKRSYRWLDAKIRFFGLPLRIGQTVRYRIDIRSFARHQDTLLFFTDFQCSVDGRRFLEIRDCCAGFFTDEELSHGQGITSKHVGQASRMSVATKPVLNCSKPTFGEADLKALQEGDHAACFGPEYAAAARENPSLRLPPGPMRMLDRIVFAAAPGVANPKPDVIAEKDLDPSDWYLRSHFKDSPVFAGPCMMEGCFQVLQFYALYLGLAHGRAGLQFAPYRGAETLVRFRSQVPAELSVFSIRMQLRAADLHPHRYLQADFDLVHHGVRIGRIENLGIYLYSP